MNQCLCEFRKRFISNEIKFKNEKMNQLIHNYSIRVVSEKNELSIIEEVSHDLKESDIIVINQIKEMEQKEETAFLLIIFKNNILFIQQILLSFLKNLFQSHLNLTLLFLSQTKEIFDNLVTQNYKKYEMTAILEDYSAKIKRYMDISSGESQMTKKIIKTIKESISIKMIIHSFNKLKQNRLKRIYPKESCSFLTDNISENDCITLNPIGSGYSALGLLCYHIEMEELLFKKKIILTDEEEANKINKREIENYKKMSYNPFLPKFYGTIKDKNDIVIEYIDGKTLQDIDKMQFTENDKITIIFELLIFFEFIHRKNLIYRDLKPNNVMIDQNKTVVLIDFDRMLNSDDLDKIDDFTVDLMSDFTAPEVLEGHITYKCDIYSLGYMMYYIVKEKNPSNEDENFGKYSLIKEMYEKCTNKIPNERPTTNELIAGFYLNYKSQIQIDNIEKLIDIKSIIRSQKENDEKEAKRLNEIGEKLIKGINCKQDINKAIEYFILSSNKNYPEALINLAHVFIEIYNNMNEGIRYLKIAADQNYAEADYELGIIYLTGDGVKRDINLAIYYFTQASNLNHAKSLFELGKIFFNEKYVDRNINKAIYYFDLAAKHGHIEAQVSTAILYHEGNLIERDLNKAIYYFDLAAKQNDVEGLFNLGMIYLNGEGVKQDIHKSIDYLQRAADQNYYKAQYNLGVIYYEGTYIKKDMNKAIKYFTFAANQNFVEAQYNLGMIYLENKKYTNDFNKGIYYLTLAANQNYSNAQFHLGCIYYNMQNVDKSIYYFELAANNNNIQAQINLGSIYYHGKFTFKNINKSIYYFSLAANQNSAEAQFVLGTIYYDNQYIQSDINKCIKYFTLAADQNYLKAQISLANIYHEGKYIARNSNKAIHYYYLAAKQDDPSSLTHLGEIYLKGNEVPKDIKKALYYYTRAADLDYPNAQYNLGVLYYKGEYNEIKRDISKALHYFTLAANNHHQYANMVLGYIFISEESKYYDLRKAFFYLLKASNFNIPNAHYWLGWAYYLIQPENPDINKMVQCFSSAANHGNSNAQLILGFIFYEGLFVQKDIEKGLNYFTLSSENDNYEAKFILGFIYHTNNDFEKAIMYYKEASLIYDNYSRNNIGIIYKNGNNKNFPKNTAKAIYFFNEAINNKDDMLAMYNLANIFIYEEANEENFNKSIELLIKSIERGFSESLDLLCLVLIKKVGTDHENIKKEIDKYLIKPLTNKSTIDIYESICRIMKNKQLTNESNYQEQFQLYKTIDFLYDYQFIAIQSSQLYYKILNDNSKDQIKRKDISEDFYKGFVF